ncbi:MAG: Ca-activated chloride channel [Gaiellaceae bacterium]|jgi:Ca-activated chloride channel family protein|nr:Ca-activated chloride channel [Gaiellaceae bacterium]
MSLGHPLLLLTLLVIPAGIALYRVVAARRRMQYAVRYTNVDVLASVISAGRPWRRWIAAGVFLLAVATVCVAVTRPHVHRLVTNDNATVVLVLDVSGSMQAIDVKPTRLVAAQRALRIFLTKVPPRLKVGLVLFAGEAQVSTPPTTDHALVAEAIRNVDYFHGFGGTAIGDALEAAVQVGLRSAGLSGQSITAAPQQRQLASYVAAPSPKSTLVSILFLSDGHQTRGILTPLQGADKAKAAGIPVYTVSLGTTGNTTMRGYPGGFPVGPAGGGGGFGRRGLSPDPKTLNAIALRTGGKFYQAKSAGAVQDAYASLGSKLGRKPGNTEVTDWFLVGAAILLVIAGALSALWSPRLP